MDTPARQAESCRACLLLWAWWVVLSFSSVPLFAQSADSPVNVGPALIDPTEESAAGSETQSPFLQGPVIEYPEASGPIPESDDSDLGEPSRWNWAPRRREKCPPNYWIISFRECPQAGTPCSADQCTQFHYHGPSGEKGRRTPAEFYASLRPDIPVCMMVHGSLIEWDQMLDEGHQTYEWLKRADPHTPFQMVFVTWPSERPLALVAPIDFTILGKRSSFNGLYLARVLSRFPSDISVSMIGHSHGARLVVSGLNLIGGGDEYGFRLKTRETPWPRLRAVMAAAALDHHWLDPTQRYGQALDNTESLLNLRNQNDFALRLYLLRLPLGRESLGRVGFDWRDQRLLGANYSKVRDVEVSSVLGTKHIWPWFLNQLQIAKTLTPYLFFQDDVPPAVTLKPQRGWPFNTEARSIIAQKPVPKPREPSKSQQLVRGTVTPRPEPPRDRETVIPTEAGRATVTPSAVRLFGNPARVPRN